MVREKVGGVRPDELPHHQVIGDWADLSMVPRIGSSWAHGGLVATSAGELVGFHAGQLVAFDGQGRVRHVAESGLTEGHGITLVSEGSEEVVWICDPMHGNTFQHASGYKTRDFDDVMRELHGFFAACDAADVWPGGVHVELTGENVTECLGGSHEVLGDHLERRYETRCDPRLNARQSLDLAFQVAELLRR